MDSSDFPLKVSGLLTQKVDEEVLVHLPGNPRVLLLDQFTSDVLHLCDGESSTEEIARALNAGPEDTEMALLQLRKSGLVSTESGHITRRHVLGTAVAIPFLMTVGLSVPAAAMSGCAADCSAVPQSSCTSINEPANGVFPPTNCASCCGTCGFVGTSCACTADCAVCACMISINVVGAPGGSCAGDTPVFQQSCLRDVDPVCGAFPGACQKDCNAARLVAVTNGLGQYACCTNCT